MEHNVVDTTFGSAEKAKTQAADILDEAARKVREMSMTAKGEDLKAALDEAGANLEKLKVDVEHKVEPIEEFIVEHPFMSIAIACGAGLLIGALLTRRD